MFIKSYLHVFNTSKIHSISSGAGSQTAEQEIHFDVQLLLE